MATLLWLSLLICIRASLAGSQGLMITETLPVSDSSENLEYFFYQQNQTTAVLVISSGGRWLTVSNGKTMIHTVYSPPNADVVEKCRINKNIKEVVNFEREIRSRLANSDGAAITFDTDIIPEITFNYQKRFIECDQFLSLQNENATKSRSKRSYMIFPGTNWCGKGNTAEYANHLGLNSQVDLCCRTHDHCPFAIEGLTSRFNTFNYRLHTLSHCECDEQFKSCLKQANSNAASMVGKVYFNVVNTQCFDLKMEKVCSRRTWWGTCDKYATQWVASVRSLGYF